MIIGYFDGAITKNPGGKASYGAYVMEYNTMIWRCSEHLNVEPQDQPLLSCNSAEYAGLICLLSYLEGRSSERILIRGDSKMVIMQMFGHRGRRYKIGKGNYTPYALKCFEIVKKFKNIHGEWIPREMNEYADRLSKFIA